MKKRKNIVKKLLFCLLLTMYCLSVFGCEKTRKEVEKKSITEYYTGEQLKLPQDANYICDIYEKSDSNYLAVTASASGLIWETDDGGQSWEKVTEKPQEVSKYYLNEAAFVDDNSVFCVFFNQKTEDTIEAEYYLITLNGKCEKVELSGIGAETDAFSDIQVKDSLVFGRDEEGKVVAFDIESGKKEHSYSCDMYTNLYFFQGDAIVLVGPNGAETYDVKKEKREKENTYVEEQVYSIARKSSSYPMKVLEENEKIYCMSLKGVFEIDQKSQKVTTLMEGREQSFGNINTWLYSFHVCSDQNMIASMTTMDGECELWLYTYQKEGVERKVIANEVSVYSLEYDSRLEDEINQYNAKKDDGYVEYSYGTNGADSVTKSDAIKQLNTELLAGKGPDIIVLDGLSVNSYIEKGVLADLSELLSDDYLENVYQPYKNENSVYAIPRYVKLMGIMGEAEAVESAGQIRTFANEIVKLYKDNPEETILDLYYDSCYMDVLYQSYGSMLLDDGKISEQGLEEFYESIKKIQDVVIKQYETVSREKNVKSDFDYLYTESWDWSCQAVAAKEARLTVGGITNVNDYAKAQTYCEDNSELSWVIQTGKESGDYIPEQIFGINVNSSNMVGAKAYLTYMLSEEAYDENDGNMPGFPINKHALKHQMDNVQDWSDEFVGNTGKTVLLPEIKFGKQEEKSLLNTLEGLNTVSDSDATLKEIIMEQAERYVNAEGSIEECVKEAKEKANIYLME